MRFMRFMKNVKSNAKYFCPFAYVNLNCSVEMCWHKCNTIARDKNGSGRDIIILLRFPSFYGKSGAVKLRKLLTTIVAFDIGYYALQYVRFLTKLLSRALSPISTLHSLIPIAIARPKNEVIIQDLCQGVILVSIVAMHIHLTTIS